MYQVELTRQAEKSFATLIKAHAGMGKRVAHAIDLLAQDPSIGIPLKAELKGLFKYRIGSYRIIYEIKKTKLIITIIDIGHRREIYR
ncbi:type II toxin-antitoxin system RelE/ParE family toxin [bacterium]|nr:type II toxin-antitoxin system RelE/ParE family toxin [bacterium]